jgi:hypothetical protein
VVAAAGCGPRPRLQGRWQTGTPACVSTFSPPRGPAGAQAPADGLGGRGEPEPGVGRGRHRPAFVRNGRMDVLATNGLGRAFNAEVFEGPGKGNLARFCFLDGRAKMFYRRGTPRTSPCRAFAPKRAGIRRTGSCTT